MTTDLLTGDIPQSQESSRRKTGVKHLNKRPLIAIIAFITGLLLVAGYALTTMAARQDRKVEATAEDYSAVKSNNFVDSYLDERSDGVIAYESNDAKPPAFLTDEPDSDVSSPTQTVALREPEKFVPRSFTPEPMPEVSECGSPGLCEAERQMLEAVAAERIRLAQLKRSQLESAATGSIRINFNRSGDPAMGTPENSENETTNSTGAPGAPGAQDTESNLIRARGNQNVGAMLEALATRAGASGLGGNSSGSGSGSANRGSVSLSDIQQQLGGTFPTSSASGVFNASRQNEFLNQNVGSQPESDYLEQELQDPRSDIELKAGTLIRASLLTGINSELPGQIIGQVTRNVWDTANSEYILIPQGSRLIGRYDSGVSYGQSRILVAWNRLIYPNGQSIRLEGMGGYDRAGQSGFKDQVNNHYFKTFSSVVLFSVVAAGIAKVDDESRNRNDVFSAESEFKIALGQQISKLSTRYLDRALNLSPTLSIRQGYVMNVMVDRDIVLPPYEEMHKQLSGRYFPKEDE